MHTSIKISWHDVPKSGKKQGFLKACLEFFIKNQYNEI